MRDLWDYYVVPIAMIGIGVGVVGLIIVGVVWVGKQVLL